MVLTLGLRHTFDVWQRGLELVKSLVVQTSLASFRAVPSKLSVRRPTEMGDPRGLTETAIYGLTLGLLLPLLQRFSDSWHAAGVGASILLLMAAPLWLANLRYDLPNYAYPFMIWHLRLSVLCLATAFLYVFGLAAINWLT